MPQKFSISFAVFLDTAISFLAFFAVKGIKVFQYILLNKPISFGYTQAKPSCMVVTCGIFKNKLPTYPGLNKISICFYCYFREKIFFHLIS